MTRSVLALVLFAYATTATAQQPAAQQQSPLQLSAAEQAYIDQVLAMWEQQSGQISTFRCPFTKWTYNAFSPTPRIHYSEESGAVSYEKPDKGSYKIDVVKQWRADPVAPGQTPQPGAAAKGRHVVMEPEKDGVVGDHWVSDGQNIYEYRHQQKQLAVTPIPPEMQGEKIVNGPFPFLFGAKAAELKERFWMKPHANPDTSVIHLVAFPKTRIDAANYKAVELQLDRKLMLPKAMQVHAPGGGREVFSFDLSKVELNARTNPLWQALFESPRTPWGWKRVVDQPIAHQAAGAAPGQQR